MEDNTEIAIEDIELDNCDLIVLIPRTASRDVMSRKSYTERREWERFDEVITKVEMLPTMSQLVNGAA